MKKYFRSVFVLLALLVSLCILPQLVRASEPPDGEAYDPDAPIDGGVVLLVAAGVGYGIKKIRDERGKRFNKLP